MNSFLFFEYKKIKQANKDCKQAKLLLSPALKSLQTACCLRHWCSSWNHPCCWKDWEGLWSWGADHFWTPQPPALMIRPEKPFSFLQMHNIHSCLWLKQHKGCYFTYVLSFNGIQGYIVRGNGHEVILLVMGNYMENVMGNLLILHFYLKVKIANRMK